MSLFGNKQSASAPPLAVVPQGTRLDVVGIEHTRGERPRVTRCESYPLDGGLLASLTRLRQGGRLNGPCAALLGQSDYLFLTTDAPSLPAGSPRAELREALRWKIKDQVDFPIAAAGLDAIPLPPQSGRPDQMLVGTAKHAVLRPLVEDFQAAKVNLAEIGIPEIAQRNIAQLFETPDRALALLAFGAQGGLLTLTCNGELFAARRLDVSAAQLAADHELYGRVVLDVQRSLDNFDRNFSQLSLQRLLVLPVPGADDFVAHLKDNLYQPVEALQIETGLDIADAPILGKAAGLLDAWPALGLALGQNHADGRDRINLFDAALQQQHDPWTARNLGLGLAAVGVVCLAWGAWAHWQTSLSSTEIQTLEPQLDAAKAQALDLEKQVTGHKPDQRLVDALQDGRDRLHARSAVLELLRKGMDTNNDSPADWLRGFARQIPSGLWLTGFEINPDKDTLNIRGSTTDPLLIPEYVKRLNDEKAFKGRTFSALEITGQGAKADGPDAGSSLAAPAAQAAKASTATPTVGVTKRIHDFALTSTPADQQPAAGGSKP